MIHVKVEVRCEFLGSTYFVDVLRDFLYFGYVLYIYIITEIVF